MAKISILIIISFIFFYILTRESMVRLIRGEKMIIEIHMQIFAFIIGSANGGEKRKKRDALSREAKRKILTALLRTMKRCKIRLNKLLIPYSEKDNSSITRIVRYRIISATILSCFDSISEGLYYSDDAVTLSPDISSIQYDVSIKLRLYQLIHALIKLGIHVLKEKKTNCQRIK